MTSARIIRELVDALVIAGGTSSETRDRLDLRGHVNQAQITGWTEVLAGLPIVGVVSMVVIDSLDEIVDLAAVATDLVGQDLRIQLRKVTSATTAFCLTENGVAAVFADFNTSPMLRQVWVASDFGSFRTESCRITPWNAEASIVPAVVDDAHVPDPRRLVKDFVGGRVPKSVFPHLLASDVPVTSAVFEKWANLAVVRLLHSLVNEVVSTEREQVVITGTRPRKIDNDLKVPFPDGLFNAATAAARWVYGSGRDVDTRFALFTYELSREWPDGLTFKQGFASRGPLALEAAETAFRAHVQETSKDTLKSLGDLRKTLSDEVTKVVSQTRDLLSTMWRDFMVAATAFLGRVVLLGADKAPSNPGPLKALLTGTAVFLVFSLFVSLRANTRFMNIADASRMAWRRKLYGFLNDDDLKKLSDEPLDHSARVYKRVVGWVAVAYIAVIACLLWSAWGGDDEVSGSGAAQSTGAKARGASTPAGPASLPMTASVQPRSAASSQRASAVSPLAPPYAAPGKVERQSP